MRAIVVLRIANLRGRFTSGTSPFHWLLCFAIACAEPLPDEWGRFCGPEAESGQPEECEAPFECVVRDDVTFGEEPYNRHICSKPCEVDGDCPAEWGSDRVAECNESIGFCKDYSGRH